mmetsp:Transcript_7103/g.17310  ORF Transcript_7103/g.17310 Transcript_7103/m.17310 type:complete len:115 (-) Transcript_7103:259-603(-)
MRAIPVDRTKAVPPPMEYDREDLCLKGGKVQHARFRDYDRAVQASEFYRNMTSMMTFVFWACFFTMVLVVFLYYDLQDFRMSDSAWYGAAVVVCVGFAAVYLLFRLFDCLAYVF